MLRFLEVIVAPERSFKSKLGRSIERREQLKEQSLILTFLVGRQESASAGKLEGSVFISARVAFNLESWIFLHSVKAEDQILQLFERRKWHIILALHASFAPHDNLLTCFFCSAVSKTLTVYITEFDHTRAELRPSAAWGALVNQRGTALWSDPI